MHILHVIQSASQIYGAERCVLDETLALVQRGHQVSVLLCHETRLGDDQDRLQHELTTRGIPTLRVEAASQLSPQLVLAWLRALRRIHPDVVHSHSLKTDVLSAPLCRLIGLPLVIEVHGYLRPDDLRVRFYEKLDRLSLRLASAVLTLSQEYRAEVIASGVSPERTYLLPSGIDLDRLRAQIGERDLRSELRKTSRSDDEVVLGMVARLSPEKGHEQFLTAFANLSSLGLPVRGVLYGEGPLAESLRRRIVDEKLNITMLGYAPQIADAYRSCDVLVSCSHNEGLPLNLIEAMALGVPTVAMATGGCAEIVEDGQTGLLVARGDVAALTQALLQLVADPSLRQRMGQAAMQSADARFSLSTWAARVEAVYQKAQPKTGRG